MVNTVSSGSSTPNRTRLGWVLGVVAFALAVRLIGLDYDQNHHFHPDERAIADAVGRLSFNPSNLQLNPKFFAYGSFPLYVNAVVAGALSNIPSLRGYDESILIGRGISAVAGTLTVLLLFFLGRRLYGPRVGLLAAFLLGACVLHVQNSHYMTTDIFLTMVVLVALVALVRLAQHGKMEDYLLSGAAIGFATATKFSALPLLAPLGVAMLIRLIQERRIGPVVVKGLAALVALVVALFLGQPYAFLDYATFSRHIDEQSRMVRNAGLLPYTNQYIGCPKYLYEIEQIVLWCMGPALGIAAVWATFRTAVRSVRGGSGAQLVLLSWVVPYFLVTGWFDVKFPRYLLPIYPIVILWAAAWLWEMADRSRFGRFLLGAVIVGTTLHLAAFMQIYFRPHTAVTASDWVYRHVPRDSKMLTQHWDEGFPFHLPGHPPPPLKVTELPYYDGEQRMPYIAEQLAESDYVALQTKRLYGAVTRDPKKYPLTNNYFYLLFAGDLGYQLVYDHASRPSLFGFEIPDELADESLTVYDHPKVLIFANKERLEASEILSRVRRGIPSQKLDRNDLLLAAANEGPREGTRAPAAPIRSSWLSVILFAALVELLGLATYPVVRRWLPVSGAYALAKVLGVLLFAYLTWLLTSVGLTDFDRGSLGMTFLVFLVVGLVAWRRSPGAGRQPDHLPTEVLFWGSFAFFLLVRAFNPEAFWGEKPMDFAFLNSLYRAVHLPPPEPWFAGSTLHYSYFGHYVVAALGRLCNIHPGITFNLGIALIAGMATAAAFAAGTALADDRRVGIAAALLTTLVGNLAGPRNVVDRIVRGVAPSDIFNFDYFWATSRVIKDTINEYPFWSLLFADLHAHLLVMPFSLVFVALTLWWVRRPTDVRPIRTVPLLFLLALTLGAIITTNTWSTFTYAAFFPFLLACISLARAPLRRVQLLVLTFIGFLLFGFAVATWAYPQILHRMAGTFEMAPRDVSTAALAGLGGLAALAVVPGAIFVTGFVVVLACALYFPYFQSWSSPSANWGFEGDAFANAYDYVTIFGLFLLIALPFLFLLWRRRLLAPDLRLGRGRKLAMALVALAAFVCLALTIPFDRLLKWGPLVYFLRNGYMRGPTFAYDAAPLSSVRVGLAILAVLALHLALQRPLPQRHRLTAALLSFAFFVTAGVDVIHIWDRMNTVFKFYLESWFVFSVAAAAAAFELWYGMAASRTRTLWKATVVAAFAVAVFTAATATHGVITTKRVRTPRPTLDGTAYLAQRDPQEAAAFEWLNSEIGGIPVIAEAYGPSYQDYARVSMNTGLPTVLGWDYHVHQRAHAWPDINRRKADLKTLYTTDSKDVARKILDNYHVALLYVGKIERREYGGGNIANFRKWDDVLLPVYENDGVTIFAVQGQFTGATEMQTIEHVPEVQSEGGGGEEAQIQAEQGRLTQPRGVAVDPQGNVFVADFGNHRIQKFDPNFVFVTGWGTQGDLPGEFKQPGDVAVDQAGNVYVADTWNQRIQVFSSTGEYVREIGGAFFGPRGIAVTGDGRVYLVDTGNHRIRRFDAKGIEEKNWGGIGSETGQFKEPVGIAVDKEGNVYVCDNGNARVEIFDADGNFKREFNVDGWEMKVFSEPHVTVAPNGTIWLTVPTQRAVRAYDQDGKLLREIVGAEAPGAVFNRPMGVALLPGGTELVVSDLDGKLVKVPTNNH